MDPQPIYRIAHRGATPLLLSLLLWCTACGAQHSGDDFTSYDHAIVPFMLSSPDRSMVLPNELNEISGLAWADSGRIAAVEDENGRLYFLNENGQVTGTRKFAGKGDYEGVEVFNRYFWVIESNGSLYRVPMDHDNANGVEKFDTGLRKKNDIEGLTVLNESLIVACKGDGEVRGNDVRGKALYLLDGERKISKSEYLEIDISDMEAHLQQRMPGFRVNDFDPSAIAADPLTSSVYVLSADHFLCILSASGELLEAVPLDKRLFRQPEGLCFTPTGDLYISSEADGKDPMLYFFGRR